MLDIEIGVRALRSFDSAHRRSLLNGFPTRQQDLFTQTLLVIAPTLSCYAVDSDLD